MKACTRFPGLLAALVLAGQATSLVAQAKVNANVSGTINYVGQGVVWAYGFGLGITIGPGPNQQPSLICGITTSVDGCTYSETETENPSITAMRTVRFAR